jgi:hypothetical protein
MLNYVHHFLIALLFTVSIETVLILFFLKKIYKQLEIPTTKITSAGIFANICTIPYVWFVFPFVLNQPLALISSELFAFVIEAVFYKIFLKLPFKQAFFISFVANLASFVLGRIFLG